MPKGSLAAPLVKFIADSGTAEWPANILELAKRHIVDTLASIVGCRDLEPAVVARRLSRSLSANAEGGATILGTRERASLADAVFASAMAGHGAEINDFNPSALVQPGPSIVSAAIALAEARRLRPGAILGAVIAGYEIAGRLPKALGHRNLTRIGLATHGFAPVFGTAAASASMLGMDEEKVGHVLSYCAQQASGSRQWLADVEHIEKSFVFAGMPARNGLWAALLVESGFTGVGGGLDNPASWLNHDAFHGPQSDFDEEYLGNDLGVRFELPLTAYKRYPVGGPTQPTVHALLQIIERVDRTAVTHVLVEMPGNAATWSGAAMPALNLRYTSALVLIDGRLDFVAAQSLERMRGDSRVRALMERVEIVTDPSQEAQHGEPRKESARVTVTLANGERVQEFVEHVRGFPAHPMSREDVIEKATELMAPALGADRCSEVVDFVWSLESRPAIDGLIELIAP